MRYVAIRTLFWRLETAGASGRSKSAARAAEPLRLSRF
jgi:hypothetical protein